MFGLGFERGDEDHESWRVHTCKRWEECNEMAPLSNAREQDRQAISEWNAIVHCLAENSSSDFSLQLIFDTEDLDTAREVIRPLDKLPTLRSFGIRLAFGQNKPLKALANETLSRITGKETSPTFHGYNFLPPGRNYE